MTCMSSVLTSQIGSVCDIGGEHHGADVEEHGHAADAEAHPAASDTVPQGGSPHFAKGQLYLIIQLTRVTHF